MFLKIYLLQFFLICSVGIAQSLDDVEKQLRGMPRNSDQRAKAVLYGEKWFDKNSNLYKVFATQSGGEHLLDWAGYSFDGFAANKGGTDRKIEYVYARRDFLEPQGTVVRLEILVPHPRSKLQADYNLLELFSQRRSKSLRVPVQESFTVEMQPVEIFESPKKVCMLSVELPQGSLLTLSTKNCQPVDKAFLKKLLDLLDIPRLMIKLVT